MNSNVSPLLDVVKVDATNQKKPVSSNSDTGFSDSFKEAKREFDKAQEQGPSSDKKRADGNEQATKTDHPSGETVNTPTEAPQASNDESHHSSEVVAEGNTEAVVNEAPVASVTGLATINEDSPVEDILTVLHDMIEQGDFEELESILSPEELAELVELVEGGKGLPLNPLVISALEAIKQSLSPAAAGAVEVAKTVVDPLRSDEQALKSDKRGNSQQADVAGATLTNKTQTVSPVAASSEEFKLDPTATTSKGAVESVLAKEGEVVSRLVSEEAKPPSSRLVNELLGPQAATSSPIAKPQLSVATPFQQAQWGEAVAERVMWMSSKGVQEAEIHLDPPELGPLLVKVSVVNEQAHVSFVVQHGSVREALDQSAMRLREMFENENIDLVDVDVSDQSEQFSESNQEQASSTASVEEGDQVESVTAIHTANDGYSLISTYA